MWTGVDEWFAQEVLPLEGMLTRYLQRVWRNPADIPDFVQEVYIRVYESARETLPIQAKAFLFATARNLVIDHIRRLRLVSINQVENAGEFEPMVDEISPDRQLSAREELACLAMAINSLSEIAREVLWLRRVEGLSQRETAERVGLNEDAVESHLARSIRTLARTLFGTVRTKRGDSS
jgi:RNA polymerase sigma factor (sigma-70 family)